MDAARIAVGVGSGLVAIAVAMLAGCRSAPAPRIERLPFNAQIVFSNVRTFVDQPGSPSEWDLIAQQIVAAGLTLPDGPAGEPDRSMDGVEINRYVVSLNSIEDFRRIDRLHQGIASLRDRRVGGAAGGGVTGFGLQPFAIEYRGQFLQAGIEVTVFGRTTPGAVVWLVDSGGQNQRRSVADGAGTWRSAVRVDPVLNNVYGYAVDRASGQRRFFRVHIYDQQQSEITRAEFRAIYPTLELRGPREAEARQQEGSQR